MKVIYYGVDLDPFEAPADRAGVRAELGLPPTTRLMIHVGRFVGAKNHLGLIDIHRAIRAKRDDVHMLLVGDGELMEQTRAQVREYGLNDSVHFLGVRSDVPRLMKAADVLVMPSVREGMPVTLIEATAAGLPVVISNLPGAMEANQVCGQAALLSPNCPPEQWAQLVFEMLKSPRPDPREAFERVKQSPFASEASTRAMEQVYLQAAHRRTAH